MTDIYGIDLMLGPDGDLVIAPNGDITLVSGADNCIQALTMRMRTVLGGLPMHPDYGSELGGSAVGQKASPETVFAIARRELVRLVEQDRRFLAARDLAVTPHQLDHGTAYAVAATVELVQGETLGINDLASPTVIEVGASDDLSGVLTGPDALGLANVQDADADLLADFDEELEAAIDIAWPDPYAEPLEF